MATIDFPDYFYNKLISWQFKLPLIKNKGLLLSLAINDYDIKLSKLTHEQLSKLDKQNKELCLSWINKKYIGEKPRGLWG